MTLSHFRLFLAHDLFGTLVPAGIKHGAGFYRIIRYSPYLPAAGLYSLFMDSFGPVP